MEVQHVIKVYYDGRTDDPNCYRWTICCGVVVSDCKIGDNVVARCGDDQYPSRIWGIEQFNRPLQEASAGLDVGLTFRNSGLPKDGNLTIYKS